jgi:hypothetical protein
MPHPLEEWLQRAGLGNFKSWIKLVLKLDSSVLDSMEELLVKSCVQSKSDHGLGSLELREIANVFQPTPD